MWRRAGRGFYTIGLTEQFDHPELVVAGVDLGHASHVIRDMVDIIEAGFRFSPGRIGIAVPYASISTASVHSVHLAGGLMAMWLDHYSRQAEPPRLDATQVLFEPSRHQPRLDRPFANLQLDRHRGFDRRRRS